MSFAATFHRRSDSRRAIGTTFTLFADLFAAPETNSPYEGSLGRYSQTFWSTVKMLRFKFLLVFRGKRDILNLTTLPNLQVPGCGSQSDDVEH